MTDIAEAETSAKWPRFCAWTAQCIIALAFLFAGTGKLLGVAEMVSLFDDIGAGQWFRYLTGGLEYLAAGLILTPAMAFAGAILAACIMAGAIFVHLLIGGSAAPAIVLLALSLFVLWYRWPDADDHQTVSS